MANFFIKISYYAPYPKEGEYRTTGSNFRSGVGKALGLWRQDNRKKKIKSITVKAIKL